MDDIGGGCDSVSDIGGAGYDAGSIERAQSQDPVAKIVDDARVDRVPVQIPLPPAPTPGEASSDNFWLLVIAGALVAGLVFAFSR